MAPVDPSELLAHAGWLRQLARSLVHEDADDIVQDTWIAALRRPPEPARSMRPWLRKVLTNAARLRWRGDANRAAREQAAATLDDRETPSSEQLLERHELQQLLARLVSELDEPFRSTILLRFAESLTPTQIARRLGIPAGTVRWRVKEALDRLRTRLDSLHRDDRRAWMVAFAPLTMPRSASAAPAAPVLPIVIAAIAACALGTVAVVVFGGTAPSPHDSPHLGSRPLLRAAPPSATSALAWLAQEGAPARALTGRVVLPDGAPAAGALVRLVAPPLLARETSTDQDGRFDFGEQLPREYALGASLPQALAAIQHVDLRDPTQSHEVTLVLGDCAASLHGNVTDASGTPIPGAQLLREGVIGTETDAHGNYELCALPTAALLAEIRFVIRAAGFGTIVMPIAPAGRMRRDFVLAPEATISGRVIAADGAAVANAHVTLNLTAADAFIPPERGLSMSAVTDADGMFHLNGLSAAEYTIRASGAAAASPSLVVAVEAAQHRDIELRAVGAGVLRGRVVSDGRPVAGVTVSAGDASAVSQANGSFVLARVPVGAVELATTPYRRISAPIHVVEGDRNTAEVVVEPLGVIRGTVRRHGVPVPFARVDIAGPSRAGVTTDAEGRFEARGLEAGKYGFYCDDRRRGAMFAEDRVFELGPGETRERDIELAWGGTVAGHVVDEAGNPVEGAIVSFRANTATHCTTDAAGAFTCGGLAGGNYAATVFPASGAANAFSFRETPPMFELRDGYARIDGARLVIEPTLLSIEGTVVDGSGAPIRDVAVHSFGVVRRPRDIFQMPPATITDEEGRFRIPMLAPGDYAVEVSRAGQATRQTIAAGALNARLVLDRPPCEGARGRDVPPTLVRPPAPVVWDDRIELVGWSVPATARVNATIETIIVYRALKPIDRDWTIFAHLDSTARRVNADHAPGLGWCPTRQWQADEVIVDRAVVRFEHAARYALTIGFFTGTAPDWENLRVSAAPAGMNDTKQQGVRIATILVVEE